MKASKTNLLSALELPCSIAGRRQSLPILNCVHLEAKDGILTIKGSDLDQTAVIVCVCEGELAPLCVRAKTIVDIISMGSDSVELSLPSKRLLVKNGATTEIAISDPREFPADSEEKPTGKGVNCTDLSKAIRAVKWAAAKEDYRYVLQSVHVLASPKMLIAESSSGRELAYYSIPSITSSFEFVLPVAVAGHLADALEKDGAILRLSDKLVRCDYSSGNSYSCKLVEGAFPDTTFMRSFKRLHIGDIARDEWVSVFRKITFTGVTDAAKTIRIDSKLGFTKKRCAISVNEADFAFDDTIAGKFIEKEMAINVIPVRQCLEAFPAESTIKLDWSDDGRALVLESDNLLVITSQPMTK